MSLGNLDDLSYVERLKNMPQELLEKETKRKIWLSAYANNNPRSIFHQQVDACYDELERRGDVGKYQELWEEVFRENT